MSKVITTFEGTSCCDVWLQALEYLFEERTAYNVVLGIEKPGELSSADFAIKDALDGVLTRYGASPVSTVATTIFPGSEYLHGGASEVFKEFPKVFDKIREGWGTYAMRMLGRSIPEADGKSFISPLEYLIDKMKRQLRTARMRAAYELQLTENLDLLYDIPLYNAASDSRRPRGGPCLSHISFKLLPEDKVALTALYRSHYYMTRTLGNLLGLAQLLSFVAAEVGIDVGPLVCHSTYALLDMEGGWSRADVQQLLAACKQITMLV